MEDQFLYQTVQRGELEIQDSSNIMKQVGLLGHLETELLCENIIIEWYIILKKLKINVIISRFLLAGDTFILDMHLGQPGLTYSACRLFTKKKERMQKYKDTGGSRYIYQSKLEKTYF